jgi:hypothetical protein
MTTPGAMNVPGIRPSGRVIVTNLIARVAPTGGIASSEQRGQRRHDAL